MTDHVRGTGGVELLEYGDFQCPYCRDAVRSIERVLGRLDGRIRFGFRHFPVTSKHPRAQEYAEAAEAAGAQGRFWEMHDRMFSHQDRLELDDLLGDAQALGLDVERFAEALSDGVFASAIEADVQSAERSGVQGTPTFFIGGEKRTSKRLVA